MKLQCVEQIEKDPILNVLLYAVGPSESSKRKQFYFMKAIKGLCIDMKKRLA